MLISFLNRSEKAKHSVAFRDQSECVPVDQSECVPVDQSTVAVTEHFGRFDDILEPGCGCLPCWFECQLGGRLSLAVKQKPKMLPCLPHNDVDRTYPHCGHRTRCSYKERNAGKVSGLDTVRETEASTKSSAVFVPRGPGAAKDVPNRLGRVFSRLKAFITGPGRSLLPSNVGSFPRVASD
ncbi:UNVERIFIED_CONTAM: Hypersensitive-induced reaction 1 protein [Sesamum latifolium]|uniref:Hypersensitive-induced reaction 1 protein n=1 Tax=Sesamum latifolium TaxID=2727402 RepID=A0AAW2X0T5_9LAMI